MKLKQLCFILVCLLLLCWPLAVLAEPVYEIVPVEQNKLMATTKMLDELADSLGVQYRIYSGMVPEIVLYGEPENIVLAKEMLTVFSLPTKFNDLIKIDCSLETLNDGDLTSLGVLPTSGLQVYGDIGTASGKAVFDWVLGLATLENLANIKVQQALSKGRILISSSLTTHNGISSALDIATSLPLATGAGNNASITYKDVPTNIKVTPTVIYYNKEHPEQSLVRLAIHMRVSYINGASTASDYSKTYPYIGARETDSVRVVRADGSPFIATAFARDQTVTASIGIPVLKDIPVLGYLFGEQYNRFEQEYCLLRVNLKFVPQNKAQAPAAATPVPENPKVTAFVNRVMSEVPDTVGTP